MRRDRSQALESSRRTVSYYPEAPDITDPELRERHKYFELLQCHMLIEDVETQVFPVGGRTKNESFKVWLSPASQTATNLVASALNSRDRGWRNDLAYCLADFFRECSQSLLAYGEALYEIVYISNRDDQRLVGFELQYVRPLTVTRHSGQLVQIVPRAVVERRGTPPFIVLPADTVLIFRLPAGLRRQLDRTLESLAILSQKLIPDFALHQFAHGAARHFYDSATQVYSQKLALAEAGRNIGWNARGLFESETLEFYSLKRQLSFERFKVELRTLMLETLNRGLRTVGKRMGFSAEIVIEGLPTIADVDKALSDLESGSKPFGEILKRFLFY